MSDDREILRRLHASMLTSALLRTMWQGSLDARESASAELDRRLPVPKAAPTSAAQPPFDHAAWFASLKPGDEIEWYFDGTRTWSRVTVRFIGEGRLHASHGHDASCGPFQTDIDSTRMRPVQNPVVFDNRAHVERLERNLGSAVAALHGVLDALGLEWASTETYEADGKRAVEAIQRRNAHLVSVCNDHDVLRSAHDELLRRTEALATLATRLGATEGQLADAVGDRIEVRRMQDEIGSRAQREEILELRKSRDIQGAMASAAWGWLRRIHVALRSEDEWEAFETYEDAVVDALKAIGSLRERAALPRLGVLDAAIVVAVCERVATAGTIRVEQIRGIAQMQKACTGTLSEGHYLTARMFDAIADAFEAKEKAKQTEDAEKAK